MQAADVHRTRRFLLDVGERAAATFGQAFLAVLIASVGDLFDPLTRMSVLAKAGLAGLAALLAVAKGLLARHVGDPDSASLVDVHDLRHRDHT